jgi:single-strand DNA-binding protein
VFKRSRPTRPAEPVPAPAHPGDEELVRGRDYEDGPETLHSVDPADLATEPAHG